MTRRHVGIACTLVLCAAVVASAQEETEVEALQRMAAERGGSLNARLTF